MTEPPAPTRVCARDLGIAAAYAAASIALWTAQPSLTEVAGLPLTVPRAVVLLLLLAASAGIALRRARPGIMLALTGGLGAAAMLLDGGLGAVIVVFEAVFSAILHGSRRLVTLTTVLCVSATAALLLWGLVDRELRPQWFAAGMQAFVVLILPLLWAGEVRGHRAARAQAERALAAEREVAAQQIELEQARAALRLQEQRTHLAQDLHDGVTGHLSAVALQTGALRSSAALREDPAGLDRSLEAVRASALEALADMRRLIDVLRADGPPGPGTASWDGLVARLRALRPESEIRLSTRAADALEDAGLSEQALRIGQEAVTNLLKHAGPGPVALSLTEEDGALVLYVESPRRHPDPDDDGSGLGLPSMRRRARESGALLELGPVDARRWRVRASWAAPSSRTPSSPSPARLEPRSPSVPAKEPTP